MMEMTFKNIEKYIETAGRHGVCYDKESFLKATKDTPYAEWVDEFGVELDAEDDGPGLIEFHPTFSRSVSGRVVTSNPNLCGMNKAARRCVVSPNRSKKIYSVDVVAEDLNVIMHMLGKEIEGDIYGHIVARIRPTIRAVVLEDENDSPLAPLRRNEVYIGKALTAHPGILFSRLVDSSFLTLDGCSHDDRGSHENFTMSIRGQDYVLRGMQRLVAGSEEALLAYKGAAILLLRSTTDGELIAIARDVKWEKDSEPVRDAATGITVTYYRGEIILEEGEDILVTPESYKAMRKDVKSTIIAYCYGSHRDKIASKCSVLNPATLLSLYDKLGIRAGLKDFVAKHREGNVLKIDGRTIETNKEAGTPYTVYAAILVQNIGVAILDELLGIAYKSGIDVLFTEHDELFIACDYSQEELETLFVMGDDSKYPWKVKIKPLTTL